MKSYHATLHYYTGRNNFKSQFPHKTVNVPGFSDRNTLICVERIDGEIDLRCVGSCRGGTIFAPLMALKLVVRGMLTCDERVLAKPLVELDTQRNKMVGCDRRRRPHCSGLRVDGCELRVEG